MSEPNRLTKNEYGCLLAMCASFRSEDPYLKVGCTVEDHWGRIIATGYNGSKEGVSLDYTDREERRPFMIHAEVNALSLIERKKGKIIYCTHSPCVSCAQTIVAHGIDEVIYLDEYRDHLFKEIFDKYDVKYRLMTNEEKDRINSCILSRTY